MPVTSPHSRPRRAWLNGLLAACFLALAVPAAAEHTPEHSEDTLKAAFIYKFTAFVSWPPSSFAQPQAPFVIGVSGDPAVASALDQVVAGRTWEGRAISVRRLGNYDKTDDLQVLYVGGQQPAILREALQAVQGPVLVVSNQDDGLRLGSVINLSASRGRVRFSVSMAAAEARSLKLSSRLLAVALSVERAPGAAN
jgi:hypothetical protein